MAVLPAFSQCKIQFKVDGPEKSYNQVRVVNETSFTDFNCRVVVLNEDQSEKEVYGDYALKERGDSDANTKSGQKIMNGTLLGVKFMKNFTEDLSYYVEYKDYPLFDVIIIHLTDKGAEF